MGGCEGEQGGGGEAPPPPLYCRGTNCSLWLCLGTGAGWTA